MSIFQLNIALFSLIDIDSDCPKMLAKANESLPQTRDSFFDDDDDDSTLPAPPLISSIRIVTSKPPVYRRQSQSSSSPSPSSCFSDRDVTDVSSLGGDHPHAQRMQQQSQSKSNHDPHHPFHLNNMRHVLLGSSAPTSRPPSPAHPQQGSKKKHVRIVADDADQKHRHQHHQQPYIHGHSNEHRRIRLTSSAINRQKQQQRIERENLVSSSSSHVQYINIDTYSLSSSSLNRTIIHHLKQYREKYNERVLFFCSREF